MPTILLVRHGQASFGAADYDELSPTGLRQAALLAEELTARGLRVHRIASGTLRRQRDTAAAAAAALGNPVDPDPRWNEYAMDEILAAHSRTPARTSTSTGTSTSTSTSTSAPAISSRQFQEALDQALAAWIAAGDNTQAPESWPAFSARVGAALRDLAADLPSGTTALVFTSGGVIAAIADALLGLPPAELLSFNRVAVNGAITKLVSGGRGISLISFNEHAHLERVGERLITYR